jgi:hypothetical protein
MIHTTSTATELIRDALLGKRCWYVSCGRAASSTFQLALGEKVPRSRPLRNPNHPPEYRDNEGEANLLVWCSWRLDNAAGPISSSDDEVKHVENVLRRLIGAEVTEVLLDLPGWDLRLDFANGLRLSVFCDHLPGDPSFDGNWELWLKDTVVVIEAGSVCRVEARAAKD